jgi:hypothetical protein
MRKLILAFIVLAAAWSCSESDPEVYTGQKLEYKLNKSSDFDFTGMLTVSELSDGNVELTVQLVGAKSSSATTFPAHLHFGNYSDSDAPIAIMLNAVSGADLQSRTILGELTNGRKLSFEDIKNFDGHVKIHLANEGPDYSVILVAGNVGSNFDESQEFDAAQMTVCSPDF